MKAILSLTLLISVNIYAKTISFDGITPLDINELSRQIEDNSGFLIGVKIRTLEERKVGKVRSLVNSFFDSEAKRPDNTNVTFGTLKFTTYLDQKDTQVNDCNFLVNRNLEYISIYGCRLEKTTPLEAIRIRFSELKIERINSYE